jgi:signal transduction histidine kinase
LKYASASKIEIQLVSHEDEITVTVEDDGKGFDPADLEKSNGHGWRNIHSRLNLIKGALSLDSRAGRMGTILIITLPVVDHVILQQKQHATATSL